MHCGHYMAWAPYDDKHPKVMAAVMAALRHPSPGVRRNAVQVLPVMQTSTAAILAAGVLEDSAAQVRLQALLALSDLPPSAPAGQAVAQFLTRSENAGDRWLVDAATCAAAANSLDFLTASAATKSPSRELINVCKNVANHFARSNPGSATDRLLSSLAPAEPRLAGAIIAGLDDGLPPGTALPNNEGSRNAIQKLLGRLAFEDRVRLARLATRGGNSRDAASPTTTHGRFVRQRK